jgi:hypothetical protein
MDKLNENMEKYVNYFKKKSDLTDYNLDKLNNILTSEKYLEFIDLVYNYFNQKSNNSESENGRLAIRCYLEADQIISSFWKQLLGEEMSEKFHNHLKTKLNI